MTANTHRESATILAFPAGGRSATVASAAQSRWAAELAYVRATKIAPAGNWYHDEAIREDAQPVKN